MAVSLPQTYLSSLQHNIRARPIAWDAAVRSGAITDDQLRRIKAVDKVRKDARQEAVDKDLASYVSLFLGPGDSSGDSVFENAAKRTDILQYILVLASDLIMDVPHLASAIASTQGRYRPLLPLLDHSSNPEDPISLLTCILLSRMISTALVFSSFAATEDEDALTRVLSQLSTSVKSQDSGIQDIALQEYSNLLTTSDSRKTFWAIRNTTLLPLINILRSAAGLSLTSGTNSRPNEAGLSGGVGIQVLYRCLLVIWQLSFEGKDIGKTLQSDYNIITLYAQLLKVSPKEKITRLLVATLLNIFDQNRTSLLPVATFVRLPALLGKLGDRQATDPDLTEDVHKLSDMLDEYLKTHTTFDEYAAEISSGHLRWSPPHRSPEFWRDNARRVFEDNHGELVKKLAEILAQDWESEKLVLEIACNDVGCLVREAPHKRQQLEKLGIKVRVMELMNDPDQGVRWESLRAVGEWLRYTFNN